MVHIDFIEMYWKISLVSLGIEWKKLSDGHQKMTMEILTTKIFLKLWSGTDWIQNKELLLKVLLGHLPMLKNLLVCHSNGKRTKWGILFMRSESGHELKLFPHKKQASGQPIKGLVFGRKWLEFISLSQITGDYNFS